MDFPITNRLDMDFYFDSILKKNFHDITTKRQYSYGHSAVKSYVVESHQFGQDTSHDNIMSVLQTRARNVSNKASMKDTHEESLVLLESEEIDFFIDLSDRRYLIFHTAEPTKVADPFIRKFYGTMGFDSLWLPVPLLLQVQDFGRLWGLGVSFKQALDQTQEDTEGEDVLDISLNVQRHFANRLAQILFNSELNHMMGISRLAVWNGNNTPDSDGENDRFIIDDVKYNGKITAKGTSFSRHITVLHALRTMYKDAVQRIESFRMAFGDRGLSGTPITIRLSRPVSPDKLVELMFSGEEPFRLWGIDDRTGANSFRVYAVDLHHGNQGNQMTIEISPETIRISIPSTACGNTILRLYANLNHYIDAMAELEVVDYELKVAPFGTRSR